MNWLFPVSIGKEIGSVVQACAVGSSRRPGRREPLFYGALRERWLGAQFAVNENESE
ncbi:hypothetical protein ALQ78_101334 [Pseudomonas syringae pv. aptata]|nr:hypothetical protein ALQ91_101895 [Pseudomonas syringae pv. syringae]RMM38153.1 hypothetical protein ALQ78_101334 [Pseudomonas syringae pv. aptata]RMS22439.1 hypothetical protein ALP69_101776 [Pseudomonas syringae pv. aceris]RMS60117.1 hypothetical protein ALP63_102155 [Pseudomonas syringae pv. aceris]RMS71089.1 hypothetical protein ALP62_102129 [Pseudomonas syringae pv. aceris]